MISFRDNNEVWADRCERQRDARFGGRTWQDTQADGLINHFENPQMDADGESPIVGMVNMAQYQEWLASYGLEVPFR